MKKEKNLLYIRQIFLRMLLVHLIIPLIGVTIIAIGLGSYLGKRNLQNHQIQVAQSVTRIIDSYINRGDGILDTVTRIYENTDMSQFSTFMKSSVKSFRYFETIYCLNKDNKIMLMIPSNSLYNGLDMSNLPDFKNSTNKKSMIISHPFISLRTGAPTVYLIKPFYDGGCVIGELNLELFHNEIKNITNNQGKDFIFIMDKKGRLIACSSSELVKQQTNMSNLGIFKSIVKGKNEAIYSYNGSQVIGSAVKSEKTGWSVVDQIPVYVFLNSYAWILGLILLALMVIWLALVVSLRKPLQRYVATPLEQLTQITNDVTNGNFDKVDCVPSISASFAEVNKLLKDFQFMSHSVQLHENELRKSESRYHGLVDRLQVGLFCAAINGEILDINPIFSSILKYPCREEVLKLNIIDLLNEASINQGLEQFTIENICNLNNFEIQIKCFDSEIIWVQMDSHIVYDNEGKEGFFEGTIQDITERKHTQELLFKAKKEQLDVLEEALIMKDEFISLISHELKTPLNVIYSAIQLIEYVYMDKIPVRVQELIGNMKQNTFRQLRLVNNLLDITRMNSGQLKLNMKNVDIVFLSKSIVKSVKLYANQKNIKMSFRSNVHSKIISIDDEKFERIVLNIISNAIKFTESGGKITVTLNEKRKLNLMEIKVTDTGIGIPKDKQEVIFEKFGQVDSNLSRLAEGTGIGLSLVKALVNILDGTIEVKSELGVGSTFTVTLPVREEVVDDIAVTEENPDIDDRLISNIKVQLSDIYF